MKRKDEILELLLDASPDGVTIQQLLDALEDGECLARLGITDSDESEVDELYTDFELMIAEQEENN